MCLNRNVRHAMNTKQMTMGWEREIGTLLFPLYYSLLPNSQLSDTGI